MTPLEMRAQFIRQRRQDRHVAISPILAWMMYIWGGSSPSSRSPTRMVHEFIHPHTGLEQRLDHQAICAPVAVGGLNQAFDFAVLQPGDRSVPPTRRLERQPAIDPLHDVCGLIVAER